MTTSGEEPNSTEVDDGSLGRDVEGVGFVGFRIIICLAAEEVVIVLTAVKLELQEEAGITVKQSPFRGRFCSAKHRTY